MVKNFSRGLVYAKLCLRDVFVISCCLFGFKTSVSEGFGLNGPSRSMFCIVSMHGNTLDLRPDGLCYFKSAPTSVYLNYLTDCTAFEVSK